MQYKRRKDVFWKLSWCSVIWNYSLWVQGEGQGGISTPSILWTVTNDLSLSIRHSIFWIGGIHFSVFRKWQNWNLSYCRRHTFVDSLGQPVRSQSLFKLWSHLHQLPNLEKSIIFILCIKNCSTCWIIFAQALKKDNTGLSENDNTSFKILEWVLTLEK